MQLLENLCAIPGTSGDETLVRDFLIGYFTDPARPWKQQPELKWGKGYKDNLLVIFGKPKRAFYAHMDTVGYTVRYDNYVVPIGGIDSHSGDILVYNLGGKQAETKLIQGVADDQVLVDSLVPIPAGTTLTYKPDFQIENDLLTSPYLDNRLAIWALLQISDGVEDCAFAFTSFEEHGGGGAGMLARMLYEAYGTDEAIIADITWATEGVFLGKGPAISLRDSRIPRKAYVDAIKSELVAAGLEFQLEVEYQGGSDGREIQNQPLPIDWCFIGPPSENQHSAHETVDLRDVDGFVRALRALAGSSAP